MPWGQELPQDMADSFGFQELNQRLSYEGLS